VRGPCALALGPVPYKGPGPTRGLGPARNLDHTRAMGHAQALGPHCAQDESLDASGPQKASRRQETTQVLQKGAQGTNVAVTPEQSPQKVTPSFQDAPMRRPGDTQETPRGPMRHPGAIRTDPEGSQKTPAVLKVQPTGSQGHPGDTDEAPGSHRKHPGVTRRDPEDSQMAPRRLPKGTQEAHSKHASGNIGEAGSSRSILGNKC
jgi:hypothetical protein